MAGSAAVLPKRSSSLIVTISFLLFLCFASFSTVDGLGGGGGGRLGGRTEIKDVKTNKEVQELGKFSVNEYNLKLQKEKGSSSLLTFSTVVKAEKQVVAGTKYFLKISAVQNGVSGKMFDAVVVVKPWENPSKELVSFDPSATSN